MKRLNKTHIFHIFFGLLMFLPFISILSRVIYVQSNKNAKDSYSGNYEITYKYQSNQVNNQNDLVVGNIYNLDVNGACIEDFLYVGDSMLVELITPLNLETTTDLIVDDSYSLALSEFASNFVIRFYNDNNVYYMNIYSSYEDYNSADFIVSYTFTGDFTSDCVIKLLEFNLSGIKNDKITYTDYNEIESVNLTGTLDNVFDYSISKFIEDNNFKINFFSWFEDLFLVQNGGVNALYLSFANWYMCYALLVSTGYLLFLILMWFINYVRKILEGGNSFGHGGF